MAHRIDPPVASPGAIPVLHDREYRVESFLLDNGNLLIQGAVRTRSRRGSTSPTTLNR